MSLLESIKQLPNAAGIYQYFDLQGRLLYVGKAKNLSKRVKSYFYYTPQLRPNPNLSGRILKMLSQTVSLNYIVVNSEHDALILENSLIKQLKPKYNILLRDDKTYPYIYIDYAQKYPRFEITRKVIASKDITYYGPFSVGAREILDSLYELCKLVQKKSCIQSKQLCLYHQIEKCLGPCALPIPQERYRQEIDKAIELITNKKLLQKLLEEKMLEYSENLRFEEAGVLRDTIQKISRSQIKSDIDFASKEKYDIFVITHNTHRAVVLRLFMRNGRVISSSHDFVNLQEGYDASELYQRALMEFYGHEKPPITAPILIAEAFEGMDIIEEHLTLLFEQKALINIPKTGKKKELIKLALLNAQELLKQQVPKENSLLISELQELFSLSASPNRIEVFDNSHFAGEATVGAMIVYEKDKLDKKAYRTYHLQAKDEYAQMKEMLLRRVASFEKNPPPDLWVLDGGTTLLELAKEILQSKGTHIDVIAIAKEKIDAKAHRAKGKAYDTIYTPEQAFKLQPQDKRLQFIQNLRDEAHRKAITFHKKTKLALDQESQLLKLHGISQAKIIKLIKHFGTFEEIKKASLDEIGEILNEKDAKTIQNAYK